MSEKIYDVIIIGGGPAGLTAGIYASREGLSALLLEKGICGGWPAIIDIVENYPGFPDGVKGQELAKRFKAQAQKFEVELIEFSEVKKITPFENRMKVQTDKAEYLSHALIVASGTIPEKLNIPGEQGYTGKGVSYCATCDGPLFKNKDVVVIGGGDTAAEEALFLSKFARKITLVHRRFELRAAKMLQEMLYKNKKIELLLNHIPVSITGAASVNSITVEDKQTKKQQKLATNGVFIFIGFLPNSGFLQGIVELDDSGYIKTDEKMQTSMPGIYAVGDIRSKTVRQIVTACGEGTTAAISVRDYLKVKSRKVDT